MKKQCSVTENLRKEHGPFIFTEKTKKTKSVYFQGTKMEFNISKQILIFCYTSFCRKNYRLCLEISMFLPVIP